MLKEEKRVTVSLGKREILLFSIALLITYGLVFAFGVEFGKSWMRSLLESQEMASAGTPAAGISPVTVNKGPVGPEKAQVEKPKAPVIEVRPRVEKPETPPPVAEGGEPPVETPETAASKVETKAEEVKKAAESEAEKAVSAVASGAKKAERKAVSLVTNAQHQAPKVTPKAVPAPRPAATKSAPARLKEKVAPHHVVGGGYLVQVGAFSKEASAKSLVKRLMSKGYHSSMSRVNRKGKTFYKVFVGPYGSETSARHAIGLLKKRERITGYLVAPKR